MLENALEDGRVEAEVAAPRGRGNGAGEGAGRAARRVAPATVEATFSLSRRHDLPFSVVAIWLGAPGHGAGGLRARAARAAALWQLLEQETRRSDLLATRSDPSWVIVFCPGTSGDGARELVARLRLRAGRPIAAGCAAFRRDALALEDLVRCAEARARAGGGPAERDGPGSGSSPLRLRPRASRTRTRGRLAAGLKRLFDLCVVASAAPLWLPLAALVAAAVKLSDPRAPIFFSQERTGRGGRRFRMYKFRTMVPEAEQLKASLFHRSERSWPDFKIADDPRITPLGRWLRRSSLDELPQLWNVLRGDMSLVGPRPTSFSAETYEAWQTERLDAAPGITGLWQVEARNIDDFAERIRIDLRYVERQGFLYDLWILLRTAPAVFWNREGR